MANQNATRDFINPLQHGFFLKFNGLKIWYLGVFGVADYEFALKIQKFKIADPLWRTKIQKVTRLGLNLLLGVFGIADYKYDLNIQKFSMADPI